MCNKFLALIALAPLAACQQGDLTAAKPPQVIGETDSGQTVYEFRITRSNALGVTPVSNAAIVQRATEICPGGYQELSRRGEATRRISGVVYTDVDVTIICT